MWLLVFVTLTTAMPRWVTANLPLFDVSTTMRVLLVPADAKVGSAIYRLRGNDADFDFPLHFEVGVGAGTSIIQIENLPCTKKNGSCEANVILAKSLEKERVYDLKLKLIDTKGDVTALDCTIKTTSSTTPIDTIFPHLPSLIIVPENADPDTVLDYVIVRKNPLNARHAFLELRGSPLFSIRQSLASSDTINGTIILVGPLDFEEKSMYMLTVYAVDAYAEPGNDTRNIVSFKLAVVVQDVQDMPPIFVVAPPVTLLKKTLKPGDVVLQVHAEDGDKGSPRDLRYGLVSEGNPYTTLFNMDLITGVMSLERPLKELITITGHHQPVILSIIAEELKRNITEPIAMSTTIQVALLLGELGNTAPHFENENYVARIDENSPQGSALVFGSPYITEIRDDDIGQNEVYSITLENNNGTFEISPTVGRRRTSFVIRVRNNTLLDFELRRSLQFTVVAREVESSLNSSTLVLVYIDDVNDNTPVFVQSSYEVLLPENMTIGTTVTQVRAEDIDTDKFGKVHYTQIVGYLNTSLSLDSITGLITVTSKNHKFDREEAPEFRFYVEARDMEGVGNRATVPLIIKLIDVNDETPTFERSLFEFILTADLRNFTAPAFLKAIDMDAEPPNNVVRYELIKGNYENRFYLNEITGELTPRIEIMNRKGQRMKRQDDDEMNSVMNLRARAYDLGVPLRWSEASIRVYPPESNARTMLFIVNGTHPDPHNIQVMIAAITGGRVTIQDIHPYSGQELSSGYLSRNTLPDKSVVVATVSYNGETIIDISQLQKQLQGNQTGLIINEPVREYRAENRALFWILMVLAILIVIFIVFLLLCCICPGCPLYVPRKGARVGSEENVHLVVKEDGAGMATKAVQAEWRGRRREAWSADQRQRQWRFNRRNNPNKEYLDFVGAMEDRRAGYDMAGAAAATMGVNAADDHHSLHSFSMQHHRLNDGPAVIYSRELQDLERHVPVSRDDQRDVYLEDIEGADYPSTGQLMDPRETRVSHHIRERRHAEEDRDTDSMRRHEVERGSDLGRAGDYRRVESNAEIVDGGREYRIVFQRSNRNDNEEDELEVGEDVNLSAGLAESRREQFYIRDGNAEILRLVTRGRSGDDRHFVTAANTHIGSVGQQQRPMTLVPARQQQQEHYIRIDNGKEIIMQKFMEDQRNNSGQQVAKDQENQGHPINSNAAVISNLQQQDILVRRLLEEEEMRLNNMRLLTEALVQHQEQETHLHAATLDQQETQSLPGQTTMATQTDVDCSTQTEPLYLMRPPRRRARSDNDDSYTEDEKGEFFEEPQTPLPGVSEKSSIWIKRHKIKRKRNKSEHRLKRSNETIKKGGVVFVGKRSKIKTPIIEETESALEAAERQAAKFDEGEAINDIGIYSENKSSMLRRRNNKVKLITTSGEVEVTTIQRGRMDQLLNVEVETTSEFSNEKDSKDHKIKSDGMKDHEKDRKVNHVDSLNYQTNSIHNQSSQKHDKDIKRSQAVNTTYSQQTKQADKENIKPDRLKYDTQQDLISSSASSEHYVKFHTLPGNSQTQVVHAESKSHATTSDGQLIQEFPQDSSFSGERKSRSSRPVAATSEQRKRIISRRESVSEPSHLQRQASSLQRKQSIAIRTKSMSQVYNENEMEPSGSGKGTEGKGAGVNAPDQRTGSRYMEWYKTKKEEREKKKKEEEQLKKDKGTKKLRKVENKVKRTGNGIKPEQVNTTEELKVSEDKVQQQYTLKMVAFEDDLDSGIAMSSMLQGGKKRRNQQLLEKKSVFTIAYDDMQTKQIRPDSTSPPY